MGVWLYDAETFDEIALLTGHTEAASTVVAFSPDGTKLVSGSVDGTVLLWDVPKSIKLYPSKQHSKPLKKDALPLTARRSMLAPKFPLKTGRELYQHPSILANRLVREREWPLTFYPNFSSLNKLNILSALSIGTFP